jgi:hypothetical protein
VVSIPVSVLIVYLFRKAKAKPKRQNPSLDDPQDKLAAMTPVEQRSDSPEFLGQELDMNFQHSDTKNLLHEPQSKKKKVTLLPYWCAYIAWALVGLSVGLSGFFTLLYSFEWGREKSSQWLTAFMLSFLQSVLLIQPIKVIKQLMVGATDITILDSRSLAWPLWLRSSSSHKTTMKKSVMRTKTGFSLA